jgi:hypothetical protein
MMITVTMTEEIRAEWASLQVGMRADVRYDPATECLIWIGARDRRGHGRVWWHGRRQSVTRLVWEHLNGPIPDGLLVLHYCNNPPCIRPSDLWLGTQRDNVADIINKGREKTATG